MTIIAAVALLILAGVSLHLNWDTRQMIAEDRRERADIEKRVERTLTHIDAVRAELDLPPMVDR